MRIIKRVLIFAVCFLMLGQLLVKNTNAEEERVLQPGESAAYLSFDTVAKDGSDNLKGNVLNWKVKYLFLNNLEVLNMSHKTVFNTFGYYDNGIGQGARENKLTFEELRKLPVGEYYIRVDVYYIEPNETGENSGGHPGWGRSDTLLSFKVVDTLKKNGFLKDVDGTWKVFKNGKVDTSQSNLQKNQYGWFYVKNGVLDRTYTGLAKNQYGWFYVNKGVLDRTYTGLAKNQYGWFFVRKGVFDRTFTGVAQNQYGKFYVKNGVLDKTFTGTAKDIDGKVYKVTKGVAK